METSNKNQLRKEYLEIRSGLSPEERARRSTLIRQTLLQENAWRQARVLLSYISFKSEVDTHDVLREALVQNKRVLVPVVDIALKDIRLAELQDMDGLTPGAYGILEPTAPFKNFVHWADVDLALIPGVAFDRRGGRIGMGAGYFDRLLTRLTGARRIALAFSSQIHPHSFPLDPHDIRMHTIVTDSEVIALP